MKLLTVQKRPGYAHNAYEGECSVDTTVEDIQRKFYDPYFGGREAWVSSDTHEHNGEPARYFRAVEHCD